ncbi:hypothetical protein JCM10450v2_002263 [Rhodotorula kratochvilovae]
MYSDSDDDASTPRQTYHRGGTPDEPSERPASRSVTPRPFRPPGSPSHSVVQVHRYPTANSLGEDDFPATLLHHFGPPPHAGYGHENVSWPSEDGTQRQPPSIEPPAVPRGISLHPQTRTHVHRYPHGGRAGEEYVPTALVDRAGPSAGGVPSHSVVQVQRYPMATHLGEENLPGAILRRFGAPPHADYSHENVFWPDPATARDSTPRPQPQVTRSSGPRSDWVPPGRHLTRQVQRYPFAGQVGEEDFPATLVHQFGPPPHGDYSHENVRYGSGADSPHTHARAGGDAMDLDMAHLSLDGQQHHLPHSSSSPRTAYSPHSASSSPSAYTDAEGSPDSAYHDVEMNALGRRARRYYGMRSARGGSW